MTAPKVCLDCKAERIPVDNCGTCFNYACGSQYLCDGADFGRKRGFYRSRECELQERLDMMYDIVKASVGTAYADAVEAIKEHDQDKLAAVLNRNNRVKALEQSLKHSDENNQYLRGLLELGRDAALELDTIMGETLEHVEGCKCYPCEAARKAIDKIPRPTVE